MSGNMLNADQCRECGTHDAEDEVSLVMVSGKLRRLCMWCAGDIVCASDDCDERNDNGEGFDGYCGNCADKLEGKGYWS